MPELTLYHRPGCHLCEDMRDALFEIQAELNFHVREIDIDADPALLARYGVLIPVLCLGEQEICHFHLNPTVLAEVLASVLEVG
jgi:glutaredoxin